jgi:hypothetical protein
MAQYFALAAAQGDGENYQEQRRRDGRAPDGLELHLEKPPHFLDIEGLQADQIDIADDRNTGFVHDSALGLGIHITAG